MTFVAPWIAAVLAVLLPAIVVLHTLRREEHPTASAFLWAKVASQRGGARRRRNVPWDSPLLWLHLAIATVVVTALAGPRIAFGDSHDHVVVLLDGSRTMRAADVRPTRFDAAVTWLAEWLPRHAGRDATTVVVVSNEARWLAVRTADVRDVVASLDGLAASDTVPAWHEALAMASDLVARDAEAGATTRVIVVGDGTSDDRIDAALQHSFPSDGISVERVHVGGPVVDVGLADVVVTRVDGAPHRWTVAGEVRSEGMQRGDVVRVQVSFQPDGSNTSLPWSAMDVALERNGRGAFESVVDLPGPGLLEVRTPGRDHLASNDVVWRVLDGDGGTVRVAIVGPADAALAAALGAVDGLAATTFDAIDRATAEAFDVVFVTGDTGPSLGTSTVWWGNPPDAFVQGQVTSDGSDLASVGGHPAVRDVHPSDVGSVTAKALAVPSGARPFMTVGDAVIGWSRVTNEGHQVALGFRPSSTVWPAQTSFPAFVASLVDLVRPGGANGAASCTVGLPCPLPQWALDGTWSVVDAGGTVVARPPALRDALDEHAEAVWPPGTFEAAFEPSTVGAYALRGADGRASWIAVEAPFVDASTEASVNAPLPPIGRGVVEVWRWLAGVAAVLLAVDAWTAWRAGVTSLSGRSRAGRAAARRTWGALGVAAVSAAAVAVLLPTMLMTASATRVVLVPASNASDALPAAQALGFRTTVVPVGARTDVGAALRDALAVHGGDGPLVVDARAYPLADVPTAVAAAWAYDVAVSDVPVALWTTPASVPGDDASVAMPATQGPSVSHVDVPAWPRAGGPFEIVVDLARPVDAVTTLEVRDASGTVVASHDVPVGEDRVTVALQAGDEGATTYDVRLVQEVESGATRADEGSVRFAVNVARPLRALFVASSDEVGTLLVDALQAQRIDVTRVTPNRISATLERLLEYDVVVLDDVPASEIHPFHQAMLQEFVRDEGRGLLMLGGSRSFGPGGYYSTTLDEVSPLSSRIVEDSPEVAMTFVLDRSGSMNAPEGDSTRMDLAKIATFEAIRLLGDRSQAAIVAFDDVATTALPMVSTANVQPFRDALRTIVAAGGTNIYPALVAAYDVVVASDASTRHIVVLTDGLSEEGDFEEILGAIGALGVNTSFVGVGTAASRGQLTRLAALGGGSLNFATDARALPGILAQEALMLSANPIEERATPAGWVGGVPPSFLETASDDLPTFLGFVETTAKDEATVVVADAVSGDPLLATWRYGVGRVAAFTTEADGPWSGAWTQSDGYAAFWSQLARWASTTVPSDPFRLAVSVHEASADVVLDVAPGIELDVPPVARLTDASTGRRTSETFMTRAPHGRWTARLDLPVAEGAATDGATFVVDVSASHGDGALQVPAFTFVHAPSSWHRDSVLDVVDVASFAGDVAAVSQTPLRLTQADAVHAIAPSVAWRGSPRGWAWVALAAFVWAMTTRFAGRTPGRRT